jgi:hypothetical protein
MDAESPVTATISTPVMRAMGRAPHRRSGAARAHPTGPAAPDGTAPHAQNAASSPRTAVRSGPRTRPGEGVSKSPLAQPVAASTTARRARCRGALWRGRRWRTDTRDYVTVPACAAAVCASSSAPHPGRHEACHTPRRGSVGSPEASFPSVLRPGAVGQHRAGTRAGVIPCCASRSPIGTPEKPGEALATVSMGPASGEARVGLPVSSHRRALPHTGAAPRLLEVATLRRGGSNGAPSGGPTVSPAPGWPWPASSPPVRGPWRRPPGERVCRGPAGVERVCTAALGPSTGGRGGLGELRQPVLQVAPDVGGISVGPGAFDQHASGLRVTGCGACTRPVWRIPGIRRGDPAPIVPHVARLPDVRQVAACGHMGQGHNARHPPTGHPKPRSLVAVSRC